MQTYKPYIFNQDFIGITPVNLIETVTKLYDKYAGMLFGLALQKVNNTEIAEGILCETFKRIIPLLPFNKGNVTGKILHVARQVCIDFTKNPGQTNVVNTFSSEEDKILQAVVCDGKSMQEIAQDTNMPLDEICKLLKAGLQKYKLKSI